MKRMVILLLVLFILPAVLAACAQPEQAGSPNRSDTSRKTETNINADRQILIQDTEGHTVVFQLNGSPGAKSLCRQLPLSVGIENYSSNEKIFYPPEKLATDRTPLAAGGAGTLAYYAPWGDVVLFYGDFSANSGLYELGYAVTGGELIQKLSGMIQVQTVDENVSAHPASTRGI